MESEADEQGFNRIEKQFNVEIVPGTEILSVEKSRRPSTADKVVLVPQPTEDPHDPLNWSRPWKWSAFVAAMFVTFTQGMGPLSLAPMFPYYVEDFNCTLAAAEQFTGTAILILGFSNFLWVPLSNAYGRRPAYILSQIVNIGATIWRAKAQSYSSFLGASILGGIGSGPAETIQLSVHADIFFLHERGRWNTAYWCFFFGSLMVGPIIAGPMSQAVGWRNFWWLFLGMTILSLLMVVFMFPETKYAKRDLQDGNDLYHKQSLGSHGSEKIENVIDSGSAHNVESMLHKGAPAKWQWKLFQPCANPLQTFAKDFWIPWKLFAFPIDQFSALIVSWSASVFLVTNLTQSQAFAAPPYNFTPTVTGFTNFATLIGALIGLAIGGPFSDWIAQRLTVRNNGIREPEMRLPAMIPFVFIMILANVVVAVGYQYKWPWEAILIVGYGCVGIQVAVLPSIASTYAVDSYKAAASSLLVSATVYKNVWGYGLSKFLTPWSMQVGFIAPIMLNMALLILWCLLGFVFYYKGKTFRRWTKDSSVHKL